MSVSSVPLPVRYQLWGMAAGRCEYQGCNHRLWLDDLTQCEFNTAYIAHIIADRPDGPRGHPTLSTELAKDITNLMLLCDTHHRLIDTGDEAGHPPDRLRAMKSAHETRIDLVTDIPPEKQSHVLLFDANIGVHRPPLELAEAARSMLPDRYPADRHPITIGFRNSTFEDCDEAYWQFHVAQMRNVIVQQLRPRIQSGGITHLSIFAIAPQPLLIQLGALIGHITFAEVYQRHKEPPSWQWEIEPANFAYTVIEPSTASHGDAALIFALSAPIEDERITAVVGDMPIWRVTIPEPGLDFLRSRAQTGAFRQTMRTLLDRIKVMHGEAAVIHVFSAMPVSLAVDLGRVLDPKASLPLIIYDQNRKTGGFRRTLEIRGEAA